MDYYERFRAAFSAAVNDWSSSLPVCTREKEFLFFYIADDAEDGTGFLSSVEKIYVLDRKSGELSEIDPEPVTEAATAGGTEIQAGLEGDEALDAEDEYLDAYEQYIEAGDDDGKEDLMQRMKESFEQLIPPSALRRAYLAVCPEFFEKISVTQD